jgi:protein arginine phosphatase
MAMRVLMVCEDNTCRSPMAAAMLARLAAADPGLSEVNVDSAGISAARGASAPLEAIVEMKKWDIDLSRHRSKPLTPSLLEAADLVLTMTVEQAAEVSRYAVSSPPEVSTLGQYGGSKEQVLDPIGGKLADYEECAVQLEWLVGKIAQRLSSEMRRSRAAN